MAYQIVRDRRELKRANERLIELLKQNVAKVWRRHPITFRPGKIEAEVCWNRQQQIWFAARRQVDHYWIAFGVVEPNGKDALNISVEINTPRKDIKRGRAGLILSNDRGQLYLAHTGRIGGGRPNTSPH